jgi:hypothetical protein
VYSFGTSKSVLSNLMYTLPHFVFGSAVMIYCFKLSPEVWYGLVSECSVVLHVKFMFFSWHLVLFSHENLRMAGPNRSLVYVMPMGLRLLFIRYTGYSHELVAV